MVADTIQAESIKHNHRLTVCHANNDRLRLSGKTTKVGPNTVRINRLKRTGETDEVPNATADFQRPGNAIPANWKIHRALNVAPGRVNRGLDCIGIVLLAVGACAKFHEVDPVGEVPSRVT